MKETTWIIDSQSGELTIEGLQQSELIRLAADLLPSGKSVNCARPINIQTLRNKPAHISNGEPSLRVFRIYHNSVVEGPGVVVSYKLLVAIYAALAATFLKPTTCKGGVEMKVSGIIELLLAPEGEPRDGVTILGGEPFLQPNGLLALLQMLRQRGQQITMYTGHTLEQLNSRPEASIQQILALTDILIDGPFVKELSDNAGEWRGSTNQRIIHNPALYFSANHQAA